MTDAMMNLRALVTSRRWAEPDRLDARLPLRWLQGETGKTPHS